MITVFLKHCLFCYLSLFLVVIIAIKLSIDYLIDFLGFNLQMWLLLLAFTLVFFFIFSRIKKSRVSSVPLPPSPPRHPLLGCFRWLRGRSLADAIEDFCAEMGGDCPIVHLPLAWRDAVYVNDANLARKLFVEMANETSDRPFLPAFCLENRRRLGIVASPPHRWTANRRFSLRVLREFGLGRAKVINDLLAVEVAHFRAKIDAAAGQPMAPAPLLNRAVGGIICSLLFGSNFVDEGDAIDQLLRDTNTYLGTNYKLLVFFPILYDLYHVPFLWRFLPSRPGVEAVRRLTAFSKRSVAEVKAHLDHLGPGHEPSNFVEAFLTDPDSSKEAATAEDEAARLLMEFFVAGVDTTSTTLQWALSFLCLHPEVQDRAHAEVTALLGPNGRVEGRHASDLPYCKALMHEVMRFGCIAPATIPHTVHNDVEVAVNEKERYRIPAGCYLHANIYALSRSAKYWRRPHDFDPVANFMDDEGENFLIRHPNAFLPFSLGKRVCIGESLARNEVFVLLVSLLQTHRLRLADCEAGRDRDSILTPECIIGPVRSPAPVLVTFERRDD